MPSNDLIQEVVLSILLPGFVVSLLAGLILSRWKLPGIALLLGFAAANYRTTPLPWFEWHDDLGRFFLALALSLFTIILPKKRVGGRLIGMVVVGLITGLLLFPSDVNVLYRFAGAAASMMIYRALVDGEDRLPNWLLLALLSATGLVTTIVMIHAHSARLGDVGLIWMACCAGMLVAGLIKPASLHGVAGFTAVLFPYLIYYGLTSTYGGVPFVSFLLLAVAPMTALVCMFKLPVRLNSLLTSTLWLLCLVIAAVLAMIFEKIVMG